MIQSPRWNWFRCHMLLSWKHLQHWSSQPSPRTALAYPVGKTIMCKEWSYATWHVTPLQFYYRLTMIHKCSVLFCESNTDLIHALYLLLMHVGHQIMHSLSQRTEQWTNWKKVYSRSWVWYTCNSNYIMYYLSTSDLKNLLKRFWRAAAASKIPNAIQFYELGGGS